MSSEHRYPGPDVRVTPQPGPDAPRGAGVARPHLVDPKDAVSTSPVRNQRAPAHSANPDLFPFCSRREARFRVCRGAAGCFRMVPATVFGLLVGRFPWAPSAGFEPAHTAPEPSLSSRSPTRLGRGSALSTIQRTLPRGAANDSGHVAESASQRGTHYRRSSVDSPHRTAVAFSRTRW